MPTIFHDFFLQSSAEKTIGCFLALFKMGHDWAT